MELMEFDLLFRWFAGLGIDDAVWDAMTFTKNCDRLLEGDLTPAFLGAVFSLPRVKRLLCDHFSVDGTLIEAWASMKSFKLKEEDGSGEPAPNDPPARRNGEVDFYGERRTHATHPSTTDPDARLYRKRRGQEAKLCYLGHALMDNHNRLIVHACLTQAEGAPERNGGLSMMELFADRPSRITLGADKGYDTQDCVNEARSMNATPHVIQNLSRCRSAVDGRVTP
jgi:Transposase domain (DUF772)